MSEQNQDRRKSWHVDRSVNLPFLLGLITLVIAAFGYVQHQDQRSTRSEESITYLKATDTRHDDEIKALKSEINAKLDKLDSKLDRLVERR